MIRRHALVAGLAGVLVAACSSSTAPAPLSTDQPLAGGAVATDRITLAMVQPDDGVRPVVEFMDGARRTLDIAVYQIDPTYTPLKRALQRAVARGVTVRVLLSRQIFPPGSENTNPSDVRALRRLGVKAALSSPEYSYSHWKTIVRDAGTPQQQALVCDFNLEGSYFAPDPTYPKEGGTRGMAALDTDRADIDEISAAFAADWPPYADQPPANRPNLIWAPAGARANPQGNATAALSSLLTGADQTIDAYIQEFPIPSKLLDPLLERAEAGVAVRVIGNKGGMDQVVDRLQQAGVQVRYGPTAVDGTSRPMYIHTKSILVDVGTDRGVGYLGSENPFVNQSLNTERELGVLVTDADSRARMSQTFDRDFDAASPA